MFGSLGQPLCYFFVGGLNLAVGGAGVGEFVPFVGVFQIPPHARHLRGDLVVAVLLSNNLQKERREEA